MLKKYIVILIFSLGVMPALCMDAPLKFTQHQAIDDELVTVELQGGQLFKVQAQHAKLSQTLKNLIDDVGTDSVLPIPNVSSAIWSKILELMLHLFDVISGATNQQEKERNKAIIFETIQSYDGATLVEFIKAVNFLDIPLLFDYGCSVVKKIDIKKISIEQILALPKNIRNPIILDQMIHVLGPVPGNQLTVCRGHTDEVTSVCVTSGNKIVSGSCDGTVRVWDMAGKQLNVFTGQTDKASVVSVTSGNKIISGSVDGKVRVCDMAGNQLSVCNGHTDEITSVCVTSDNKIVSGSYDGTVRVWDMAGNQLGICDEHTDWVRSVCATFDNKIVSGSDDCTVRIWDINWASDISIEQAQQIWRYLQSDGEKNWDDINEIFKPIHSKRTALMLGVGAALTLVGVCAYKWFTNNTNN